MNEPEAIATPQPVSASRTPATPLPLVTEREKRTPAWVVTSVGFLGLVVLVEAVLAWAVL